MPATPTPSISLNMIDDLYSGDILTLASTLRNDALTEPTGTARKTAKLCGSEVEVDLRLDGDHVAEIATRVKACALGQASAAILRSTAPGASCADLTAARDALHALLKSEAEPDFTARFAALSQLAGVRAYPARHASTLLPWQAAVAACGG